MKLICIDDKGNSARSGFCKLSITAGESYEIIHIGENAQSYYIINDNGEDCVYSSSRFRKIDEHRDKQLNNILNGN